MAGGHDDIYKVFHTSFWEEQRIHITSPKNQALPNNGNLQAGIWQKRDIVMWSHNPEFQGMKKSNYRFKTKKNDETQNSSEDLSLH
jgi:hypothetical protein